MKAKNDKLALFIMRITLGFFLLLWGLEKIVTPDKTLKIFKMFYGMTITTNISFFVGLVEVFIAIAIMTAMWKQWSYGLGLLIHV